MKDDLGGPRGRVGRLVPPAYARRATSVKGKGANNAAARSTASIGASKKGAAGPTNIGRGKGAVTINPAESSNATVSSVSTTKAQPSSSRSSVAPEAKNSVVPPPNYPLENLGRNKAAAATNNTGVSSKSSNAAENNVAAVKTTVANTSSRAAALEAKKTILPPPNFPPPSELISGVHALAEAAASAKAAPVKAAPVKEAPVKAAALAKAAPVETASAKAAPAKRKVGRPRKNASAPASTADAKGTVKRKVGRPRKPLYSPASANAIANVLANTNVNRAAGAASTVRGLNFPAHHSQEVASAAATSRAIQMANKAYQQANTTSNVVSQSLPGSNASSDNDNAKNEGGNRGSIPSPSNFHPLPLRSRDASSVYDDEYARFMRSIMGDDQSIKTFKTWKSLKSQGEGSMVGESVMGSAFETLDEDDVSYQLTSDEDDEDDDEDDDENTVPETELQESPQKRAASAATHFPPTTPLVLPHSEETNDEELMNVFGEIEGLMEEDLEAAVMASLIGGPDNNNELSGSSWQKPGTYGVSKTAPSGINKASMGAIMGTQQQKAITTPGQSTKKMKSTATVVTTPSPIAGRERHAGPVNPNNAARSGGALEVPAVSKDQLARLRGIMARHHQLLLQQATLSVRAAYVQKVRKDGLYTAATNSPPKQPPMPPPNRGRGRKDSSLPESRLDTRSLTFCSRPADSGCSYANDFFGGETPEELSECLDGAVGMLQDLEQNWKDAVRNSIQLSFQPPTGSQAPQPTQAQAQAQGGRRNLNFGETAQHSSSNNMGSTESGYATNGSGCERRLTRSAFTKTLLEREMEMSSPSKSGTSKSSFVYRESSPIKAQHQSLEGRKHQNGRVSVFDVRGLARLRETFSALDNSVKDIQMGREKGKNKDGINILAPDLHGKACETLLKHARAEIDTDYLPGRPDLGRCLTHAPEAFEEPDKVSRPLTKKQEAELRKNRHTFSAGEDNLILRGVNLYGEKEWCLVSDRFLPDRVVNSISQRYNKLCFLIYKANGIKIDEKGKLGPIPTFPKGATYDISKINTIRPARAPTTMNVHRWTLEEDVAILKAVPIMGNLWAEICTQLMPHRDGGHIRKRYQVLQRRIPKGITKMNMKYLKRPPEQRFLRSPARSPKRARTSHSSSRGSPSKKKVSNSKKAAVAKTFPVPVPAPAVGEPSNIAHAGNLPALAAAAGRLTATITGKLAATTALSAPISEPVTTAAPTTAPASGNLQLPAAAATAAVPTPSTNFQRLGHASKPKRVSPMKKNIKMSPIKTVSPLKSTMKSKTAKPQQLFPPKRVTASSSPLNGSPTKEVIRPFSLKNHGSKAMEAVINSEVERSKAEHERQQEFQPSPETRGVAALLGGFATGSRLGPSPETRGVAALLGCFATGSRLDMQPLVDREHEENTQMGIEKILDNDDDWSQASGMDRLIEAGAAESNFMCEPEHVERLSGEGAPPRSPSKSSNLPAYRVHDGEASGLSAILGDHLHAGEGQSHHAGEQRKSILSSVIEKTRENARKRKIANTFPGTPTKKSPDAEIVIPAAEGYPSSIPTSTMTFSLDTPAREEGMGLGDGTGGGELSMNPEFFEYFMSDGKSRQASSPGRAGTTPASPAKASVTTPGRAGTAFSSPAKMMTPIKYGNNSTPIKYGNATPLSQYGTLLAGGISGPHEGCNSLFMGASDFDAVAALKDLSNSAPNTPSKLLRLRDDGDGGPPSSREPLPYRSEHVDERRRDREAGGGGRKKARTSLFGQVKAKVDGRKSG